MDLTHFNDEGRARMVDVSDKAQTLRTATASATVYLNAETYRLVTEGRMKKGDVLAVAQVGGIMAAKRTFELIPMCHPIALTGVEMEALTAASAAALTIYDMCKAVQRDIVIGEIKLLEKSGGKSGHFVREET